MKRKLISLGLITAIILQSSLMIAGATESTDDVSLSDSAEQSTVQFDEQENYEENENPTSSTESEPLTKSAEECTMQFYEQENNDTIIEDGDNSVEDGEISKTALAASNFINNLVNLDTAEEVSLDDEIIGTIDSDTDIDIVRFTPKNTGLFKLIFQGETDTVFEVLSSDGNSFIDYQIDDIGNTAYLFESGQYYYIRVRGNPNSAYSVTSQHVSSNTIVWGFNENTLNFSAGQDASISGISDGNLKVTINKTSESTYYNKMAYIIKNNPNIDVLNYSKIIIRLKNCTNMTRIESYLYIDSDYNGSETGNWTQTVKTMTANSQAYENIVFDLPRVHGQLQHIMLGLGGIGTEITGNVLIDSICFVSMPDVYGWEFDGNTTNWYKNALVESADVSDGSYVLKLLNRETNLDPAIHSPIGLKLPADFYNKIQISIKNQTPAKSMDVYFNTYSNENSEFSLDNRITVKIEPNSNEFIEYTFDLLLDEDWYGMLNNLMVVIYGAGNAEIDYIRLARFEMDYPDIVWNFNDNTVQDFTVSGVYSTDICKHVISAENKALVVEKLTDGTGGVFTPDNLTLPVSKYRYLILGVNSASADSKLKVYFNTTKTHYTEDYQLDKIVNTQSIDIKKCGFFREYVIDLASVPDGWATNYLGYLKQLAMSLSNPGTFEFDYIKLSTTSPPSIPSVPDESDDSIYVNVQNEKVYNLAIRTLNVLPGNNTVFTVIYDEEVLLLDDACAFTYGKDTQQGEIPQGYINIVSIVPGKIQFKVTVPFNKMVSGVINCIKFQGISTADTYVSVTQNNQ